MKVEAAFIFIAPETNFKEHRACISTPVLNLTVVGVKNYEQAVAVAKELCENGVKAIELCAGFGMKGTALVSDAVATRAKVGAVRFDCHPGFEYQSGDDLFGN